MARQGDRNRWPTRGKSEVTRQDAGGGGAVRGGGSQGVVRVRHAGTMAVSGEMSQSLSGSVHSK